MICIVSIRKVWGRHESSRTFWVRSNWGSPVRNLNKNSVLFTPRWVASATDWLVFTLTDWLTDFYLLHFFLFAQHKYFFNNPSYLPRAKCFWNAVKQVTCLLIAKAGLYSIFSVPLPNNYKVKSGFVIKVNNNDARRSRHFSWNKTSSESRFSKCFGIFSKNPHFWIKFCFVNLDHRKCAEIEIKL